MTAGIKRITPNYKLKIPYFDTPLWGTPVEQNYDIIDALLFAGINITNFVGLWTNNTQYLHGQRVADQVDGSLWECNVSHISALTGTFAEDRLANPTYWTSFNAQVLLIDTADIPPAGAQDGRAWWDSSTGRLYVWYEDGNSGQWVHINPTSTAVPVSLSYTAIASQTAFPLTAIDLSGQSTTLLPTSTVHVIQAGLRLAPDKYSIASSTVTLVTPASVGQSIIFDVWE